MRLRFVGCLVALTLVVPVPQQAQQSVSTSPVAVARDAQGVALLQKTVTAMAATQPADSTASGNVTIVEGSTTIEGTFQILTRGSSQSSVQLESASHSWTVVYSSGQGARTEASATTVMPLELAASNQSLHFPLPYLSSVLNNADFSVQFVGQEALDTSLTNHLRVQNTFTSIPMYQFLSEFTIADIWLDASTGLPSKIAMTRRYGGGASARIPISFLYSNYKTISGVSYPYTIEEYLTATLWATTNIQSVSFNSGLTDSNFPVAVGAN
jgi:hypothetical protein